MTAPVGAIVSIYYDGRQLEVGDWLRTPTGRTYEVVSIRVQQRGKHRGRQHIGALVREDNELAKGQRRVVPLAWYSRSPREGGPT